MPTLWSHSMFWEDHGEAVVREWDMNLLGVARPVTVGLLMITDFDNLWINAILIGVALVMPKILVGVRGFIFKLLGGKEYGAFLQWLASNDSLAVKKAVYSEAGPEFDDPLRPISTKRFMENAYIIAGRKGAESSGWKRRMLIYFWYGRKVGKW